MHSDAPVREAMSEFLARYEAALSGRYFARQHAPRGAPR